MSSKLRHIGRVSNWLGPALGLLLVLGSLVLGMHMHSGSQEHRTCAACIAGDVPAVVQDAAPAAGISPRSLDRPIAAIAAAPTLAISGATLPRAPPHST